MPDHARARLEQPPSEQPPIAEPPIDWAHGWNMSVIWDQHARTFADAPALIHDGAVTSWHEFGARAASFGSFLGMAGLGHQAKVAQYLYNSAAYLESVYGTFRAGLVPVNTNYRYLEDELEYLWGNADVEAVVFHGVFAERCAELRRRNDAIKLWIWVDDGSGDCPGWAVDYETVVAGPADWAQPEPRSGDDLYLLYTGGTTGMPKGVMWRQDDLVVMGQSVSRRGWPAQPSPKALADRVVKPGPVVLPIPPLMHGTGSLTAFNLLNIAGCVVTVSHRSFVPEAILDAIDRYRVESVALVGDAMTRPLVQALRADPDRWDLSSVRVIGSSGAAWSPAVKQNLAALIPDATLVEALGSSEAPSLASSSKQTETPTFKLGPGTRVIDEAGNDVPPGSPVAGRIALRGRIPLGYYKDPEATAKTFIELDDGRYSIPGDWVTVEPDGRIRLLGRGSECINTGGEKVFPEEVEAAIKELADVRDVAVVGILDETYGQTVAAVVDTRGDALTAEAVIAHVKSRLAGYKAPRAVLFTDIERGPNGKLDLNALRALATNQAAGDSRE